MASAGTSFLYGLLAGFWKVLKGVGFGIDGLRFMASGLQRIANEANAQKLQNPLIKEYTLNQIRDPRP